ncbi:hypothetical protein QR680_007185 [Steinernema hermaphroditum]|uniref:G-protein coupled receptors family 1 profile domain-containing protein n=1 Tax=Steinernema hermaphroditum TaxID=289476 RepID=A0AA39HZM9_9BILA|nr:hypothetical protein QR680_007185 [Steinernema hermaphroditum]
MCDSGKQCQMNYTYYIPEDTKNDLFFAANIILVGGIASLVVNVFVIYGLKKTQLLGWSFGPLCMSQCIANCGNAITFGILVSLISIFDPAFHSTYWGARCGQLFMLFYYGSFFSHFLSATNRLFCITYPMQYPTVFSRGHTKIWIGIAWLLACGLAAPFFYDECTVFFDIHTLSIQYLVTACTPYVAVYLDYYLNIALMLVLIFVDLATLHKIKSLRNTVGGTLAFRKKQHRDTRLFMQTVFQALLIIIELALFYIVADYFQNKWMKFVFTTIPRVFLPMFDGVIVIFFNKELRPWL